MDQDSSPEAREVIRYVTRNNQNRAAAHCLSIMEAPGHHRDSGVAASLTENGRGGESEAVDLEVVGTKVVC